MGRKVSPVVAGGGGPNLVNESAHVGGILLHEFVPDGNLVGGFTVGPEVRTGR